ncbi:MAG: MipA/OmpV family protein [Burkholderiales bacterium]|nr:MipA/OmpV family protein [Burkholderiales bacterium]
MRKILCFGILCTTLTAQAAEQRFSTSYVPNNVVAQYLPQVSYNGTVEFNPAFEIAPISKLNKSGSGFTSVRQTRFNFSKNDKLQYGLELGVDQAWQVGKDKNEFKAALSNSQFSTSGFLNYQIDPNYALSARLTQFDGREVGNQFSLTAKVGKKFNRKHHLSAHFSVNWIKPGNPNWASLNSRSLADYPAFSLSTKTRSEIRLGASWNWNINHNWSLSTGVNARHSYNDADRSWLNNQRSPVTVFSVLSYHF